MPGGREEREREEGREGGREGEREGRGGEGREEVNNNIIMTQLQRLEHLQRKQNGVRNAVQLE